MRPVRRLGYFAPRYFAPTYFGSYFLVEVTEDAVVLSVIRAYLVQDLTPTSRVRGVTGTPQLVVLTSAERHVVERTAKSRTQGGLTGRVRKNSLTHLINDLTPDSKVEEL